MKNKIFALMVIGFLLLSYTSYALTEQEAKDKAKNLQEGQSVNGNNIIIESVTIKRENFITRFFRDLFIKQEALGLKSSYNQGDRIPVNLLFYLKDTCPSGRVEYWAILKHKNSDYIDASLFILSQTGWTDGRLYTIQKSGGINTDDSTPSGDYTLTDYILCDAQSRRMKDKDGKTEFTANFELIGDQICEEDWTCGEWSSCTNNQQIRICTDNNNCGTTDDKPDTTQECSSLCPVGQQRCEDGTCAVSCTQPCTEDTRITCSNGDIITTHVCTKTGLEPTGQKCQDDDNNTPGCINDVKQICEDGSEIIIKECREGTLYPTNKTCGTTFNTDYLLIGGAILLIGSGLYFGFKKNKRKKRN